MGHGLSLRLSAPPLSPLSHPAHRPTVFSTGSLDSLWPSLGQSQGWLLLIGFVLGQVQAIAAWSQGKGPILAEL